MLLHIEKQLAVKRLQCSHNINKASSPQSPGCIVGCCCAVTGAAAAFAQPAAARMGLIMCKRYRQRVRCGYFLRQGAVPAAACHTHQQVFVSKRYTYASILHKVSPSDGGHYVASASTLQKDVRELLRENGAAHNDVKASVLVGKLLADKAKEAKVQEIHFDNHRNLKFEGKVRALIESIRSNGIRVK